MATQPKIQKATLEAPDFSGPRTATALAEATGKDRGTVIAADTRLAALEARSARANQWCLDTNGDAYRLEQEFLREPDHRVETALKRLLAVKREQMLAHREHAQACWAADKRRRALRDDEAEVELE